MDKRTAPYIGITGFMNSTEVHGVIDSMPADKRLLMVGVLASLKTLRPQGAANKNRYPFLSMIDRIFINRPGLLNMVHYNTSEPETLAGQLAVLMSWAGPNCDGVQLNMAWPDFIELDKFRNRHPAARIVLQCGMAAMYKVEKSAEFAKFVAGYYDVGLIDDVLIDSSGGNHRPLDTGLARQLLRAIADRGLLGGKKPLGIVVAGGLSATTLDLVEPLYQEFPQLSIDVEGLVRDSNDHLSVQACRDYLRAAEKMFQKKSRK